MSVRSICTQGAPPIVTINMSPDATNANRAIIYDPTVQAYAPGDPIIGEFDSPTLTLAGNGTTTVDVTLTAVKCLIAPNNQRLVTLQFPATVTAGNANAAAALFTGTISDVTLAPVAAVRTSVNIWDAVTPQLTPAILSISTAGVFTITSSAALQNVVQNIGFTVTYMAKAVPAPPPP